MFMCCCFTAMKTLKLSGRMLLNSTMTALFVRSRLECITTCVTHKGCLSVNVMHGQTATKYKCELNHEFSLDGEGYLIDSPDHIYYELQLGDCTS